MDIASCIMKTLGGPVDYRPPVSSVHRIFQARILEQVAISFSRGVLLLYILAKIK